MLTISNVIPQAQELISNRNHRDLLDLLNNQLEYLKSEDASTWSVDDAMDIHRLIVILPPDIGADFLVKIILECPNNCMLFDSSNTPEIYSHWESTINNDQLASLRKPTK